MSKSTQNLYQNVRLVTLSNVCVYGFAIGARLGGIMVGQSFLGKNPRPSGRRELVLEHGLSGHAAPLTLTIGHHEEPPRQIWRHLVQPTRRQNAR